jgi:hypothetical protein
MPFQQGDFSRGGTEINLRYTKGCLEGLRPAIWPPIKLPIL